jgi:aspartate-semialdehyde dehydrogenase
MGYRVAVVGATGNVGREMLNILEEVKFPVEKIHAIASRKSIGLEVEFGEQILKCEDIAQFDFSNVDIVLMSVSGAFSKEWSPKIAPRARSSSTTPRPGAWTRRAADRAGGEPGRRRVGEPQEHHRQPNCSTAQLVVALKPLHDARDQAGGGLDLPVGLRAGKEGMDELFDQTKNVFVLGATPPKKFPKQIAFNVIPFIGAFQDDGYTDEEQRCGTRPTRCSTRTSR